MTDYSDYVHCGEVFRSSTFSNEKPYLFKCIQCQDIFQFEAFLTHFEQNLCDLREISIKEVLDDACLSGCHEKDKNEGDSIDEIEVNQVDCLNKVFLVFIKDEDVSNADEKDHVWYKMESSDAEVDSEQQEFETDVSLDDDFDLVGEKYDSENTNVTDETEYLVKRKQGDEEETIANFIENHDNVMALIEAYKAQAPLWNRSTSFRDKEERQKYLEIVTKELNQKRNLSLNWHQVYTLISHLLLIYSDDLKKFKDSQKEKSTHMSLWFCKHMKFLQPFMEKKNANGEAQKSHLVKVGLVSLDPHLPSLRQDQIVQILKIYENLPHLWNTSLIEYRSKNKRYESEMEMIKRIKATLAYEIDCEALNKYLKSIHLYFFEEKRKTQNDGHLQNSGLCQHLDFLLDHVGPFRCSQCDFEYLSVFKYKIHLSQHDDSMPFKCSQCGKEFKGKGPYDYHARRHFGDFKDICQVCGRKFLNFTNLRIHMRRHTKVMPYCCEICGTSFRHLQSFNDHKRRHINNVRDYVCKTCEKAFKTKQHLRVHEVTHSDVRKYVCTICSKSFKLGSHLTKHMRIHGRNLSDNNTTTSEDKMTDTDTIVKEK